MVLVQVGCLPAHEPNGQVYRREGRREGQREGVARKEERQAECTV